jgi:hypothetical protein
MPITKGLFWERRRTSVNGQEKTQGEKEENQTKDQPSGAFMDALFLSLPKAKAAQGQPIIFAPKASRKFLPNPFA